MYTLLYLTLFLVIWRTFVKMFVKNLVSLHNISFGIALLCRRVGAAVFGHTHEMFSVSVSVHFLYWPKNVKILGQNERGLWTVKFTEFKRFIMNYSLVLHISPPSPRFSVRAIAAVTFDSHLKIYLNLDWNKLFQCAR